jgi:hypothetical protein
VIGTDKLGNDRFSFVQQASAAVATDVVQHTNFALVISQQDEARLANVDDSGIASFRNIAVETDTNPVFVEENIDVRVEDVFTRVEAGGQRVAVRASVEKGGDGGGKFV